MHQDICTSTYKFKVGLFQSATAQDVLVGTTEGTVRGSTDYVTTYLLTKDRVVSQPFYKFLGIPYAQPPVGPLRFKPPRPPFSRTGVRNAKAAGEVCFQKSLVTSTITGSEDCLYLNIYTPKLPTAGVPLKAVMFWIHGGEFQFGDGIQLYGPDYLVTKDVVVVTFNYRLNVLGFLSLQNNQASGNYGLKDQVQALKWVQQNIANFGGDPLKVTIFGESAGGVSVHYHLLSHLSRGLFQQAIIQSGSAFSNWAFTKRPKSNAFNLAQFLGQNITDENELYNFFMTQPAYTLAEAASQLRSQGLENVRRLFNYTVFVPSLEDESDGSPFLSQLPTDAMSGGNFTKVPLMIGTLNADGVYVFIDIKLTDEQFQIYNTFSDWAVPPNWRIQSEAERGQIGEVVKLYLFNGNPVSFNTVNELVKFYSDSYFVLDTEKSVAGFLNHSNAPIYQYEMTFEPLRSPVKLLASRNQVRPNPFSGAAHSDDVSLIFRPYLVEFIPFLYEEQIASQKVSRMWTNFAKTGNPNYEDLGVTWKPLQNNTRSYLDIGSTFSIKSGKVQQERLQFWEDLCKTTSTDYNCEF